MKKAFLKKFILCLAIIFILLAIAVGLMACQLQKAKDNYLPPINSVHVFKALTAFEKTERTDFDSGNYLIYTYYKNNIVKEEYFNRFNRLQNCSFYKYDDSQNIVAEMFCNSFYMPQYIFAYQYYSFGNIIKKHDLRLDPNFGSPSLYTTNYAYDNQNLMREDYSNAGNIFSYDIYEYNNNNQLIKLDMFDSFNEPFLQFSHLYSYDQYGNITQDMCYRPMSPTCQERIDYEYDDNNNVIKETYYVWDLWEQHDKLTLSLYITLEYDENNLKTKRTCYNVDDGVESLRSYIVYEYTDNGNTIKEEHYAADGQLSRFYIEEYDRNHNIILSQMYNPDKELEEYTIYKYTSLGKRVFSDRYKSDGTPTY